MKFLSNVIRWFFRIVFLAVIVAVITGIAFYYLNKPATPPTLAEAPWVIQTFSNDQYRTPSRLYLASKVTIGKDGTPQATDWWSYNGKSYEKHEGIVLFPKDIYGTVDIKRRKN